MKSFISTPFRYSLVLLIVALLVSGCSSSSDSNSGESLTDGDVSAANENGIATVGDTDSDLDSGENSIEDANAGDTTSGAQTESTESTDASEESTTESGTGSSLDFVQLSTTRVNFEIIVPVYSSNALQVRLVWGDMDITAMWVVDERWIVSADFPVNTTNQLFITFSDDNGAVTLGSFETSFTTAASQSESVQITADQFDTERWDSNGDGVSNIAEAIAGTNPGGDDPLQPVLASLEILPIKNFRISWQPSEGATFYRVLENPDGVSGYEPISNDIDASARSYNHEVALYSRFNARYIVQACNASGCVDSAEQVVSGSLESAVGYLKPEDTGETGTFGQVVLSADGKTLASSGSLTHVYVKENGSWQLQAAFAAGGNISLSADGNTLAAAGPLFRAIVFVRSNGDWSQQAELEAVNEAGDVVEEGNRNISISADGNTVVVGIEDDDSIGRLQGAAYVFVRNGESWEQQAQLLADPNDESISDNRNARFGHRVSINAAGDTIAVSAENEVHTGFIPGVVHVFVKTGGVWQRQAALVGRTVESQTGFGTSIFAGFGRSLSLNADGDVLAVGSIDDHALTDTTIRAGAVYLYERSDGTWQQQGYVQASNPPQSTSSAFNAGDGHAFGQNISLNADGSVLAVGAIGEHSVATGINGDQTQRDDFALSGAVYVFTQASGSWQQKAYVKALAPHGSLFFGGSLSLDGDGKTLAVGAPGDRSGATGLNGNPFGFDGPRNGAIFLY